jgi:hypothetical protein
MAPRYGVVCGHGIDRVLFSQALVAMELPSVLHVAWLEEDQLLYLTDPATAARGFIAGLIDRCPGDDVVTITGRPLP